MGPRDQPLPDHGDMPLSERAKQVLSDAVEFTDKGIVTPLHLFWAMLGASQGDVTDLLAKHGFNRQLVEKAIRTGSRHLF